MVILVFLFRVVFVVVLTLPPIEVNRVPALGTDLKRDWQADCTLDSPCVRIVCAR